MVNAEFSSEFDILYNNIMSNIAPGLTEYEKSVFLTQSQEQMIIEIYNGQLKGEPFETSEEIREYLRALIQTSVKTALDKVTSDLPDEFTHYRAEVDISNLWYIIFESATLSGDSCINGKTTIVKPTSYDEYWAITRNPFRGPNENRVLRVNRSKNLIELISAYDIEKYILKYLSRPNPIILEDLNGITINGKDKATQCELPNVLHRPILIRAVQLAKNVWGQQSPQ